MLFKCKASTLGWMLVLLANHPTIQKRMRDEIRQIVPNDRLPNLDDKHNLIYVEAFIHELFRFKGAVPITALRFTIIDSEVSGYFIPANTIVRFYFFQFLSVF